MQAIQRSQITDSSSTDHRCATRANALFVEQTKVDLPDAGNLMSLFLELKETLLTCQSDIGSCSYRMGLLT